MSYCPHCGNEINEEAVVCVSCGCSVERQLPAKAGSKKDDTLITVTKVFLIIACVVQGWMIVPLAWCIPMTVSIFKKLKNGEPIGTGLKVCTLIFVSLVSGICLLCMEE